VVWEVCTTSRSPHVFKMLRVREDSYLRQTLGTSSLPSLQSFSLSHCQWIGMHRPLAHLNSVSVQVRLTAMTHNVTTVYLQWREDSRGRRAKHTHTHTHTQHYLQPTLTFLSFCGYLSAFLQLWSHLLQKLHKPSVTTAQLNSNKCAHAERNSKPRYQSE
jgi:hypothetical protein